MKYIGPFLRINTVNKDNIKKQLFYLSKESLKNIVLYSKCGVTIPLKELKIKTTSNIDITTITSNSPLLCVYKKADAKLINDDGALIWNESKFKKEIPILANAFMTLSLLELVDYYEAFKKIDPSKYYLKSLYLELAKSQLEFYASYFRSNDGVFVDKLDLTDPLLQELKFEDKENKFKFSNQAFMMAAFYKYSCYSKDKEKDENNYKDFALDILNMLIEFKEEIYCSSFEELTKLCFALNIFYKYSNNMKAKNLLIDFTELLIEKFEVNESPNIKNKIEINCMLLINSILIYQSTEIVKFENIIKNLYDLIIKLYDSNKGLFIKHSEEKELKYSCDEIILYLHCLTLYSDLFDDCENNSIIQDIFKHGVVNSGIVLSWPDTPCLDDVERYKNFSLLSEDLLHDENFRMPTIPTPENNSLASIFIKYITFNKKKEIFKQDKFTFDSTKNMFLFFINLYLCNDTTFE